MFRTLFAVTMTAFALGCAATIPNRPGPQSDTLHGVQVDDPYRWLEASGDPAVRKWMAAQDAHARHHLDRLEDRLSVRSRLKSLYYIDASSVPVKRGGRYFFERRSPTAEKASLYVREADGAERVLIDPTALGDAVSLGVWVPSKDGSKLAFATKLNNADEATLRVLDVDTGRVRETDIIPGAKYAEPSWTPNASGFFYSWLPIDPSIPVSERPGHAEIRFHRLGTEAIEDVVVHRSLNDPTTFLDGRVTDDGAQLVVTVWRGWSRSELFVRALEGDPKAGFEAGRGWRALTGGREAMFHLVDYGDRFYIATNEGAPRFRVFSLARSSTAPQQWHQVVAEDPEAVLRSFKIVGGKIAIRYLKNASSAINIFELDGTPAYPLALPGLGSVSRISGSADDDEAFFSFSSFTHPRETHRATISTGRVEPFQRLDVPVDRSAYIVKQVWYPSKDGTRVSMFIVHRKGLVLDGDNPTLLYGYGGFNVSLAPAFRPWLFPWLDRGGVYAVPNLRGGGEYGEAWHAAGMGNQKQNVFDDFIAAAQWLAEARYTRPERLAVYGRSNGGLLVGAAMTQRPDLFAAVVCGVPLLDMVRYHLFGSGKTWIPEYGSAEDATQFPAIYAYSPYHRVAPGTEYPALLMLSVDSDDRVDPMHARKFVARVQDSSASGAPMLLTIEKNAGHGGADQRESTVRKRTDMLSFLFQELAMRVPRDASSEAPKSP